MEADRRLCITVVQTEQSARRLTLVAESGVIFDRIEGRFERGSLAGKAEAFMQTRNAASDRLRATRKSMRSPPRISVGR